VATAAQTLLRAPLRDNGSPPCPPYSWPVPSRPSPEVLRAFGLTGTPIALDSGQGTSWRVADAVLKPLDMSPDEVAWLAHTYEQIVCDGFRVAVPLQANNGQLVVDGWTATKAVSGRHESGRWKDIIVVGERFHGALIGVGRPEFIDRRTNKPMGRRRSSGLERRGTRGCLHGLQASAAAPVAAAAGGRAIAACAR
jgi:hypothetical protein